ncbi:hypothetical protein QJS10_CPA02g01397 [Acorus calamus]|nr:hypothetical protein QJS10_CPA02g01397 [Acorus calamus]
MPGRARDLAAAKGTVKDTGRAGVRAPGAGPGLGMATIRFLLGPWFGFERGLLRRVVRWIGRIGCGFVCRVECWFGFGWFGIWSGHQIRENKVEDWIDHLLRLLGPSHGELWIPATAPLEQPQPLQQQQKKRGRKHHRLHRRRLLLLLPVDLLAVAAVHPSRRWFRQL